MKSYYNAFNKLKEFQNPNRELLIPYIHKQKKELSFYLGISSEFWISLDYAICLTKRLLKSGKNELESNINTILKPIFKKHNKKVLDIYRKIPEKSYKFLKYEMKTFHHIITHTINLIDKKQTYLIPNYLFIDNIDNMLLLYPLNKKTIEPQTLANGNYAILMARHIAPNFSTKLLEAIDTMLWLKTIFPLLIPEDKTQYTKDLLNILSEIKEENSKFDTTTQEYSMLQLIIELRETITKSIINETVEEIVKSIKLGEINFDNFLKKISNIFVPDDIENKKETSITRDNAILLAVLKNIKTSIKNNNKIQLFENILIGKAMIPFLKNITTNIMPQRVSLYIDIFIELIEFLEETYPASTPAQSMNSTIEKIEEILNSELEKRKNKTEIKTEDIMLFTDKIKQIYAKS